MTPNHKRKSRPSGQRRRRREALYGYAFLSPQLFGFLLFVIGPLVAVFVYSLQTRNLLTGQISFVGLQNYKDALFHNPLFWRVLLNSLIFAAGLVPFNMALALVLALLLSRPFRGVTVFRTMFFAPVVTSAVAWAIVWRFMLQGEHGTVNQFLGLVGIHGPNWLRQPAWAMVSVIGTRVLKNVGLNMIIYIAALQGIPREYSEAAAIDGANRWQVFRNITLPLLAPTTLVVSVITIVGSLKVFDQILLMTHGGPGNATMVLVYYIYQQAFQFFKTGYASTLAVTLFVVTLGLTLLQWAFRGRES